MYRSSSSDPRKDADAGSVSRYDWVEAMPWWTMALAAGVAVSALALDQKVGHYGFRFFLFALIAVMMTWFVRAFTYPVDESGDAEVLKRYRRQIFIFAYAFTFISFVVVVMPAGSLASQSVDEPRSTLPLNLFYGCFDYSEGSAVPNLRLGCDKKMMDSVTGEKNGTASKIDRDFALLLAVGGSAARPFGSPPNYAVSGGLVLPLYVVLIAMIGGAISLSRRIPEIQKRADPNFPGTPTQSRLRLYEAREQVIFQIMQLVSAPFIAICSFHILEPAGQATSVTLGFACGFASEVILLMIRGVVDKIRPGVPSNVAHEMTNLEGVVVDTNDRPVFGAKVRMAAMNQTEAPTAIAKSGSDGRFVLHDVPKRKLTVEAAAGLLTGQEMVDAAESEPTLKIVIRAPAESAPSPVASVEPPIASSSTAPAPAPAIDPFADSRSASVIDPTTASTETEAAPPSESGDGAEASAETFFKVTGTVVDTAGRPVAGAEVRGEGATLAATSGADGRFELQIPAGLGSLHATAADGVREGSAIVDTAIVAEPDFTITVS